MKTVTENRAEDLTHEALIIVLKKMRSNMIKDPKKLTSYMFQTARFCYFGWLRRVDNQVELGQQYDDIPGALLDADVEQLNRQRDEILHDSIDSLAVERDREILMRHYVHDQNKLEICDALLLTVESYDRVISRARLRLKTYVTRAGELAEYCTGMPGNTLGHAL